MIDRPNITVEAEKQSKLADIDVLVLDQHFILVRLFFENVGAERLGDKCDLQVTAVAHVVADRVVLYSVGIKRCVLARRVYLSVIFDTSVTIEQFNDAHGVRTL